MKNAYRMLAGRSEGKRAFYRILGVVGVIILKWIVEQFE
jgi:hypothetical protein